MWARKTNKGRKSDSYGTQVICGNSPMYMCYVLGAQSRGYPPALQEATLSHMLFNPRTHGLNTKARKGNR